MKHWASPDYVEPASDGSLADILAADPSVFDYSIDPYAAHEFVPLDAPGMPPPGPDFLAMADSMGDYPEHTHFKPRGVSAKEWTAAWLARHPNIKKYPKRKFNLVKGTKSEKRVVCPGPNLTKLYRQALYAPRWSLNIYDRQGRVRTVNTVPGHLWGGTEPGPKRSPVMIIGKWPGDTEIALGRTFIGPSGQQLKKALVAAGIDEATWESWYVTNLIKHPPLKKSADKVPARWVSNWLPVLEEELRIVRPDFILVLGTDAARHLLRDLHSQGVTSTQGRTIPWHICLETDSQASSETCKCKEVRVMTCRHPASVIRDNKYETEFLGTIRRFKGMLDGTAFDPSLEKVDHRVVDNEADLKAIVDDCLARGEYEVALDCEWEGDYPTEPGAWLRTIQFSTRAGFAVCVKLRHGGYHPTAVDERDFPRDPDNYGQPAFSPSIDAAARQLKRLLVDTPERKVRIIGHNLRADLPWIAYGLDIELGDRLIDQFQGADDAEQTRTTGGFDTMLAVHSVYEAPGDQGYKLEALTLNHCGVPRYDSEVIKWRNQHCSGRKIKKADLSGYGNCPDNILFPYACWDADGTFRLYEEFNGKNVKPGQLDRDCFGQSSRLPFWISMRASPACLEIEMTGLHFDVKRAEELRQVYEAAKGKLTAELRKLAAWPDLNPNSSSQCTTLLFGPEVANVRDADGRVIDVRTVRMQASDGKKKTVKKVRGKARGIVLDLEPVATTGKPKRAWKQALRTADAEERAVLSPNADKETLGILLARLKRKKAERPDDPKIDRELRIVDTLRNIRFVSQVTKSVIAPPCDWQKDVASPRWGMPTVGADAGKPVYSKGLLKWLHYDSRLRTHVFQTKETGRWSTARPALQNLSKRREKDYKKVLDYLKQLVEKEGGNTQGLGWRHPMRSIIAATPGWVLVEADYIGAELFMMAIQSGDEAMIDHCLRANLKEDDPQYYDIHSNMAVAAFQLDCKPTKQALLDAGHYGIRDVAKTVMFGLPYGRGDEAIVRGVEEEGTVITLEQAAALRAAIFNRYPRLQPYIRSTQLRAHNPGWIANCLGRRRRHYGQPREDGSTEREFGNFGIQSGVADLVSEAINLFYVYPNRWHNKGPGLAYRIVLQIHDAILFEVRPRYVEWFVDVVLKECMMDRLAIYECDLDGNRVPGACPYHFGYEASVMSAWGVGITMEEGEALGIPEVTGGGVRLWKRPKEKK